MRYEILAGVGNWDMLTAAQKAGANSIYFGVTGLNMRNFAKNFQIEELKKVANFCHKNDMKAYLTLNTIIYDSELLKLERIIKEAKKSGIDAIIAFDFAAIEMARKYNMEFHISTQMSISNSISANFFKNIGAQRIVTARECSLKNLENIKNNVDVEVEIFIHGAMCFSLSGRCYLSLFMHDKSANRGECTQPCRRVWTLETIPGEKKTPVEIYSNTIMSSRDLCTIDFIDNLYDKGFRYFKIEGRTKTPDYVYQVVKAYREAIDAHIQGKLDLKLKEKLKKDLEVVFNRGFTSGFYNDIPNYKDITQSKESLKTRKKIFLGNVSEYFNKIKVFSINHTQRDVNVGDKLIIEGKTTYAEDEVLSMHKQGKEIKEANKGEISFKINNRVRVGDKVFKVEE